MLTHSNTTLVSINLDEIYLLGSVMNYSNTTLVSINQRYLLFCIFLHFYSNTTLVSINPGTDANSIIQVEFKYNSCFY